jgi:hypothetical protein
MCGPATIPILAAASAVVSTAGTIYSGMAKVAEQNARLANEQARDAKERGQREAQLLYRRYSQLKGQQQASMAANGIDTGFGSALDVQRDTAMMAAEDAGTLYKNTEAEMKGFEINAANYRSEAQADRIRGKAAMTGSLFSGAGSLLEGASQYGQIKAKFG